jgi:hypothetical protein
MIVLIVIAAVVLFVVASWFVDRRRSRRNELRDAQGALDPEAGGLVSGATDAAKAASRPFATEQAISEANLYGGRHSGMT